MKLSCLTLRQIEPSEQLIFHPCFDRFEGARLQVPMNWNSTYRSDDKVAIAIVRLPAKVPVSDPQHGGLLMIQPGKKALLRSKWVLTR